MPDAMVPFPELIAQAERELSELDAQISAAGEHLRQMRAAYDAERDAFNRLLARHCQVVYTLDSLKRKAPPGR
jgi:DNA-binding transcriptional MocR family regulator